MPFLSKTFSLLKVSPRLAVANLINKFVFYLYFLLNEIFFKFFVVLQFSKVSHTGFI